MSAGNRPTGGEAGPGEGKTWFSVKEAAAYLGKSEPTIFRWMKDGTLSFYKVGRATRFLKESLDAVVDKTTGSREAEAVAARCAACGHTGLMNGHLQSTGLIYFRPDKTRFWTFADSMVRVQGKACPACGFIQLHADTKKLGRLAIEDAETSSEESESSSED